MRKCIFILLALVAVWPLSAQTEGDSLPLAARLRLRLDTLLTSPMLERSQVGLMVWDLTADSALYAHNARQTMRPASTQKLVTAIAAIDRLGGSYQLRTSLYYHGTVSNGTLTGDLIVVGGMDPAFGHDDVVAFVQSLHEVGIDTLAGRVMFDRSFKDDLLLGEGWCWDDDNPVLSPVLLNKKDGMTLPIPRKPTGVEAPMPANYSLPAQAVLVSTRTHTIDQILGRMMKESDNLYAEALFYQLAASGGNRPAKASHARQHIQRLIQKVGLNASDYRIADGSGLSLYNYLSAELHVRLLRYAYQNKNVLEHLLPSLPIGGVDGTLKNRMKGTAAGGNVRAKTGTVTCVSCLAGYCTAANGHDLCFAIMNNGVMKIADGRAFQDRVCRALCAGAELPVEQVLTPVVPTVTHKTQTPRKPQKSQSSKRKKKRRRR